MSEWLTVIPDRPVFIGNALWLSQGGSIWCISQGCFRPQRCWRPWACGARYFWSRRICLSLRRFNPWDVTTKEDHARNHDGVAFIRLMYCLRSQEACALATGRNKWRYRCCNYVTLLRVSIEGSSRNFYRGVSCSLSTKVQRSSRHSPDEQRPNNRQTKRGCSAKLMSRETSFTNWLLIIAHITSCERRRTKAQMKSGPHLDNSFSSFFSTAEFLRQPLWESMSRA